MPLSYLRTSRHVATSALRWLELRAQRRDVEAPEIVVAVETGAARTQRVTAIRALGRELHAEVGSDLLRHAGEPPHRPEGRHSVIAALHSVARRRLKNHLVEISARLAV